MAEKKSDNRAAKFPSFEELLEMKISRRKALSTGAKAGIGVAAVAVIGAGAYAAYLSSNPPHAQTQTVTSTLVSTATSTSTAISTSTATSTTTAISTSTATSTVTQPSSTQSQTSTTTQSSTSQTAPTSAKPSSLNFYQWAFEPPVVKQYALDKFSSDWKIPVMQNVLPRVGYEAAMETNILGGGAVDTFYVPLSYDGKWLKNGWMLSVDGEPEADLIKKDIIPAILSHYTNAQGELIMMPYYMSSWFPFYNKRLLAAIGAEPAKTRDDVLAQCQTAKQKLNLAAPYHGVWGNGNGTQWLWAAYVHAEGLVPFDEKGAPMFQGDPRMKSVLTWMHDMFKMGLTSPNILTEGWDAQSQHIANAETLYIDTAEYVIGETGGAEVANMVLLPKPIGATDNSGRSYLTSEWNAVCKNTASKDWAWEMLKYSSWKINGQYVLPEIWATQIALLTPYQGIMNNPVVQSAFSKFLDWPTLQNWYSNLVIPAPYFSFPWFADYTPFQVQTIQSYITDQITEADCEKMLADKAVALASASS